MSETTIFLILDAFRHDYLDDDVTPTLSQLADDGAYGKKLKSTSGFTQRSGIFTGTHPDVHKNYTMFTYEPGQSPYSILRPLRYVSPAINFHTTIDAAVRRFVAQPLVDRFSSTNNAPVARIPYEVLPSMSVSEGVDKVYNEGALGVESIFDVMRAEDVEFEYLVYPDVSTDAELTETLVSEVKKQSPKDVYLGQFISSDRDVHKAGVNSTERVEITEKIDKQIDAIRTACEEHLESYNLCIIGDHGMMDVETYVDIYAKVTDYSDQKGLSMGQDFLLFLDSTLARFWFFTDEAKELLSQFVENELSNLGEIIDEDRAAQKRLPDDRRYGDLIWEASPGVLIYPDYFHRAEKYNAMHGYDNEVPEMKGFAIAYGADAPESTSSDVNLIDFCPTLCDLIDIAYPEKNEGESMIPE